MKKLSLTSTHSGQNSPSKSADSNNNLSNAGLFHNPIRKYFNIHQQTGSYGVELIWKIYRGTRIQNKKEEVSIFYFEKKLAEKLHKPRRRETVCEILRKDVQNLMSVSHRKVLSVIHQVEENNDSLAFATEKIHCSLANILGNYTRMDPQSIHDLSVLSPNQLNLKHGIYQISEALRYLNTSMQYCHNSCSPFNILISERNAWKLGGMAFAEKLGSNTSSTGQISSNLPTCWTPKLPKMAQPALDFIAPEIQLESRRSETSDMFSFGLVICCLYSSSFVSLIDSKNSASVYMERVQKLNYEFKNISSRIPEELQVPVEKMLSLDVKVRPNSQLFALLKYFNDSVLMGLEALLNLTDHEPPGKKVSTLKSLQGVINKLPQEMLFKSAFKILIKQIHFLEKEEFKAIVELIAEIIQIASLHSFDEYLMVDVINLLNSKTSLEEKIDCFPLIDPLMEKIREETIRSIILPFVFDDVLDADNQSQVSYFGGLKLIKCIFSNPNMTDQVMQLINAVYNQIPDDTLILAILEFLATASVTASTSKDILARQILPFLLNIKYNNPSVMVPALNLFKRILDSRPDVISCRFIACELMQKLVPETVNPKLKIVEFKLLMELLHLMLDKIDKEYWKTHSSVSRKFDDHDDTMNRVPKIQMQECTTISNGTSHYTQLRSSNSSNSAISTIVTGNTRRESQEYVVVPAGNMYGKDSISPHQDTVKPTSTSQSISIAPPNITKSSPTTPQILHKYNTESKIFTNNQTSSGANTNNPAISLNVPLQYSRRHSFGSSTMLQQEDNSMITASICEGPFIGASSGSSRQIYGGGSEMNSSGLYASGSRRPSCANFIQPDTTTNKGSTDNLTVNTHMTRRSSFNALSDTVMNLFHS